MALRSTRTDIEQFSAEGFYSVFRIHFSSKLKCFPIISSFHESKTKQKRFNENNCVLFPKYINTYYGRCTKTNSCFLHLILKPVKMPVNVYVCMWLGLVSGLKYEIISIASEQWTNITSQNTNGVWTCTYIHLGCSSLDLKFVHTMCIVQIVHIGVLFLCVLIQWFVVVKKWWGSK